MTSTSPHPTPPVRMSLSFDLGSYPRRPSIPCRRLPPLSQLPRRNNPIENLRQVARSLQLQPATRSAGSALQHPHELVPREAGHGCTSGASSQCRHLQYDWHIEQSASLLGTNLLTFKCELLHCVISGIILLGVFGTYLGLALSNHDLGEPFAIAMIVGILVFTIVFLHAVLRMHMLRQRQSFRRALNASYQSSRSRFRGPFRLCIRKRRYRPSRDPDVLPDDDAVYAPRTAVRVHLAQDEEAAKLVKSDGGREEICNGIAQHCPITVPPPAYGLWRCSVRADPTLLFWHMARTNNHRPSGQSQISTSLGRPPSYAIQPEVVMGGAHSFVTEQLHGEHLPDEVVARREIDSETS